MITFSIILVSCVGGKKTAENQVSPWECIETVIAIDDSLGTVRNHACEEQSLSTTIDYYVTSL